MMEDWKEEGFEALHDNGFESDYVAIDAKAKTIRPAWTAEYLLSRGFIGKGSKVRFLNKNGYDGERERAAAIFVNDMPLTVKACRIGQSSSDYTFEEVEGRWNTVMFEEIKP